MATNAPSFPPGVTINNTLGAILVGFAVSCIVYGILTTQIYVYFTRYPSDRPVYKFLVLLILALETADQSFIGHVVYHYGISNFDNLIAVLQATVTWSFIMQQAVGALVGCIVKTYFALRVWRFSQRNYFVTGLILLLTYGQMGLAMTFTCKAFQLASVFSVVQLRVLGTITLGVGVLTDLVTSGALIFYLLRLRTGYQQSDSLVHSLVRYTINTGAVTTAVSSATVVLYNLMPHNLVFIGTYFILSKLYAISFLATLNTRRILKGGAGTDREVTSRSNNNNTNLFQFGTRIIPSMGPTEMQGWDTKDPDYYNMPALPDRMADRNLHYAI